MDTPVSRRALHSILVFLFAGSVALIQCALQAARRQDMETSFFYVLVGMMIIGAFIRLLNVYVRLDLDPSELASWGPHSHHGPNGPPGPDSNPGGCGSQPNGNASRPSEGGPARGGSSTAFHSSGSAPRSSFGRYRGHAVFLMIVLIAIMYLQFVSSRGNEYFCEIDEDYLTDRFNLTGLNTEVSYYQYALDLVTDVFDLDADDDLREQIEKSARHLYGLVHARYIVTTRGLGKMVCWKPKLV